MFYGVFPGAGFHSDFHGDLFRAEAGMCEGRELFKLFENKSVIKRSNNKWYGKNFY